MLQLRILVRGLLATPEPHACSALRWSLCPVLARHVAPLLQPDGDDEARAKQLLRLLELACGSPSNVQPRLPPVKLNALLETACAALAACSGGCSEELYTSARRALATMMHQATRGHQRTLCVKALSTAFERCAGSSAALSQREIRQLLQ